MLWPWDLLGWQYDIFLEYPLLIVAALLGVYSGIYIYFLVHPEDLQKVKDFLGMI